MACLSNMPVRLMPGQVVEEEERPSGQQQAAKGGSMAKKGSKDGQAGGEAEEEEDDDGEEGAKKGSVWSWMGGLMASHGAGSGADGGTLAQKYKVKALFCIFCSASRIDCAC